MFPVRQSTGTNETLKKLSFSAAFPACFFVEEHPSYQWWMIPTGCIVCLYYYRICTKLNRGKLDLQQNCSPSISVKPRCRAAHSDCVNETDKRRPQGVLTQTGPQTIMPKSYKLLWCLNKTHINLSCVIFLWRSPTLKCFHLTFI